MQEFRCLLIEFGSRAPGQARRLPGQYVQNSRIVFAGAKGPFGWDDVAFEETLKKILA